jgi:hypothetical protein
MTLGICFLTTQSLNRKGQSLMSALIPQSMKTDTLKGITTMLGCVVWALTSSHAWAVLGQAPTTYPSNTASAFSAPTSAATSLYTTTTVTIDSGVVIKEFTRPDGLVFAVSWRGPVLPDLSTLLGTYFPVFMRANEEARATGRRGSPVSVARDGLVVQASGRRPHFFGYAYITHLTPAGINVKDVVQ